MSTLASRRRFLVGAGASLVALGGCSPCLGWRGKVEAAYAPWEVDGWDDPALRAVAFAILAASPHNSQPWLFAVTDERIDLFADLAKSLGPMDVFHREMFVGLGCALENLTLAADAIGLAPEVVVAPDADDDTWVASVAIGSGEPVPSELFDVIPHRHTHRGAYAALPLTAKARAALADEVTDEVHLDWLEDPGHRGAIAAANVEATEMIVADAAMNEASHRWWRHTPDELVEHRDGLTMDALGTGVFTKSSGKCFATPSAETAGRYWIRGAAERESTGPAVVLMSTPDLLDIPQLVAVGRAYQRMQLRATILGLATHPTNQAAERRDRELEQGLEPTFGELLAGFSGPDRHVQMIFRIGVPWDPASASPRRPVPWVTS